MHTPRASHFHAAAAKLPRHGHRTVALIRRGALLSTPLLLLAAMLVAACGGGAKDVFDDPPDASRVAVRLSEYKIETRGEATDAVTKLSVQNTGTVTHDIKLVRTDLASDALPRKDADVDESKVEVLAKTTDLKRREKATMEVKLQPGNYVLFCNISGHYKLGMHAGFKVSAK